MRRIKRMLSLFLALALLLGTLPLYTLAEEPDAALRVGIGEETISDYSGKPARFCYGYMSNIL